MGLDVISGELSDPLSAADIDVVSITLTGVPALLAGTPLALEIKDETYAGLVNEYGANAKMFVVAVGETIPPGAFPYYVEEY